MTKDETIAEIRRVAGLLQKPTWRLSRDEFLKHSALRWGFEHHGTWHELRGLASVGYSPLPAERQDPPIDPVVPPDHHVRAISSLVDASGNTKLQWIKTRRDEKLREAVLQEMLEALPDRITPRAQAIAAPYQAGAPDLLAIYPMGDPHLGMRAWGKETGSDDFDLDKALAITKGAIDTLVSQAPYTAHALIANLGDFYHADNFEARTARSGHALDVDSRWSRTLQAGVDLMIYIIDRVLESHSTVTVVNEIGNHDDHSAIMLSVALAAYYRNESRVTIDLSPSRFHYHRFGKNLIGITHGHSVKHDDLESIMSADRPEDWGATEHRFWLVGHIHHTRRLEYRGCVVESFRTLAPRDAWAAEKGYRAGRDMSRIVVHREFGEASRSTVSAQFLKSRYDLAS